MEKKPLKINICDIPDGKGIGDYPDDTVFVLSENEFDEMMDDNFWEEIGK